jgi:DNA-binding NarL/FixJ family response regulator
MAGQPPVSTAKRAWPRGPRGVTLGSIPVTRELVTLAARGRTDTQIAAEPLISVRPVGSHPDRIRDKTGCRRRADLTGRP